MLCSQCGQFYVDIVPTRCACGGALVAATGRPRTITADLLPYTPPSGEYRAATTAPADDPLVASEMAWFTPSMVGDVATHPTSPYTDFGDTAPPPPPEGLSEWYSVPHPQRLAQLGSIILGCLLILFFGGSAIHAQFTADTAQSKTLSAPQSQRPPAPAAQTSGKMQPQANPAVTTTQPTGTTFTVQISAPIVPTSTPASNDNSASQPKNAGHNGNHGHDGGKKNDDKGHGPHAIPPAKEPKDHGQGGHGQGHA